MSVAAGTPLQMPWLPPGHTMVLEGRGEVFYRHQRIARLDFRAEKSDAQPVHHVSEQVSTISPV